MDISYKPLDVECPSCSFVIQIVLKQVLAAERILCPGCYSEIQLVDEGSTLKQAQSEIDDALSDLQTRFRRLGR
jgi:Zn finger protein HypA/HybF involved in hydrogenase expression